MPHPANPQGTYALVVGIEEYAAGPTWNELDGPVPDARRFSDWLLERGVPAENISLFLSPRESNRALLTSSQPHGQPATQAAISDALVNGLSQQRGDLLYIFWGGHGMITAAEERWLFYADATANNMLNLDLASLLTMLRSTLFRGFDQQICIIDACANFVEDWANPSKFPRQTFPQHQPREACEQCVLFAAKAGDLAGNLNHEQTGLFSRQVLEQLAAQPAETWPPDIETVNRQIQERFISLRNEGKALQTPNFFQYRDWQGNQQTLSSSQVRSSPPPAQDRALSMKEKFALVDALLDCPTMQMDARRNTVLLQLRPAIAWNINRDPASRFDVFNTVATCLHFTGGIAELVEAVRAFEVSSAPMQNLDVVVRRLGLAD
jgi:hypothetical protein